MVAFCRPLAVTIYAFVEWQRSGTFNPSRKLLLNSEDRYTPDFFTPDAWNCQLEDYIPSDVESTRLQNLCVEGTAARTMTLAITVLSVFVLYGVVWRTYRRYQAAQSTPSSIPLGRPMTMRSTISDQGTVYGDEKHEKAYGKNNL
jgi:hypothetical protein